MPTNRNKNISRASSARGYSGRQDDQRTRLSGSGRSSQRPSAGNWESEDEGREARGQASPRYPARYEDDYETESPERRERTYEQNYQEQGQRSFRTGRSEPFRNLEDDDYSDMRESRDFEDQDEAEDWAEERPQSRSFRGQVRGSSRETQEEAGNRRASGNRGRNVAPMDPEERREIARRGEQSASRAREEEDDAGDRRSRRQNRYY